MWINLDDEEIATIIAAVNDEAVTKRLTHDLHRDGDALFLAAIRKYDNEDVTPHALSARTVNGGYVVGSFWITNDEAGVFVDPTFLGLSAELLAKLVAIPGFKLKQILLNGEDEASGRLDGLDWTFEFDDRSWSFTLMLGDQRGEWSLGENWEDGLVPSKLTYEAIHEHILSSVLKAIDLFRHEQENPLPAGEDDETPGMTPKHLSTVASRLKKAVAVAGLREMTDAEAIDMTRLLAERLSKAPTL